MFTGVPAALGVLIPLFFIPQVSGQAGCGAVGLGGVSYLSLSANRSSFSTRRREKSSTSIQLLLAHLLKPSKPMEVVLPTLTALP